MGISSFSASKAILIARVSSDEQEEYSPAAQQNRMKDYCERQNLTILDQFEITESSTRGDRKEFLEVIKQAKKSAKKLGEPIAIVTDKVDRLQRGFKQQPILEQLREDGLLEYHFSSDNCIIHKNSAAKDLFMWNIAVALAQNYTDSLSDNVNRAKEQKLQSGEWIGHAPIGYLNVRDDSLKRHGRGKADVILDPARAPLVRHLFEKYATGCYSGSRLVKLSKEIGLTTSKGSPKALSKSQIHKMLKNPFYYGVMRVLKTGEHYAHRYEPIISKALFDQCQDVRTGRYKPNARYGKKPFLFRGLITCAHSGKLCTAQEHKRTYKNGSTKSFTYLVSYDKEDRQKIYYTREEGVLAQIEAALDTLTIRDPQEIKDVMAYIRAAYKSKHREYSAHVDDFRREDNDLERKINRLTDLRLNDELTASEYQQQKRRFHERRQELTALIKAYETTDDNITDKLSYLMELAAEAVQEFRRSSFEQKRELLSYVFQNLQLDGKKLVYSMHKPFDAIAKSNKSERWCPLVDAVRTCEATKTSISEKPVPYWKELMAA